MYAYMCMYMYVLDSVIEITTHGTAYFWFLAMYFRTDLNLKDLPS